MALIKSSPLTPFPAIKITVTFCNLGWCKVDWHLLAQKYNLKLWNNGTSSCGSCQHFQIALLRRFPPWYGWMDGKSALNVYLRKILRVVSFLKLCHFGLTVPCASMWLPCVWIARSGRVTLSMSYRFPISPQGSEPRWWSSIWLLTHRAPNSAPSTDAILVACLIFNQQSELWAVDLLNFWLVL